MMVLSGMLARSTTLVLSTLLARSTTLVLSAVMTRSNAMVLSACVAYPTLRNSASIGQLGGAKRSICPICSMT